MFTALESLPTRLLILLVLIQPILFACSSGNSNSPTSFVDPGEDGGIEGTGYSGGDGGIEGTGLFDDGGIEGSGFIHSKIEVNSTGVISGFGSIFVNGIEYDTDTATIISNGVISASDNALKLGMVVQVIGSINPDGITGKADFVIYDQILEGPIQSIESITASYKIIKILGLSVQVSMDTVLDNINFDDMRNGQVIRVSGFSQSGSTLQATRLEKIADEYHNGDEIEIEHEIQRIDFDEQTLSIGDQDIDFSAANLTNFPQNIVDGGFIVEVKGDAFNERGQLMATHIEIKAPAVEPVALQHMEVAGLIQAFESIESFKVNDLEINADAAKILRGNAKELEAGFVIEVEGVLDQDNILQAQTIVIKKHSTQTLSGFVISVDHEAGALNLEGVNIRADVLTRFEDRSDNLDRYFRFSDIAVGEHLSIGVIQLDSKLLANSIVKNNVAVETASPTEASTELDPTPSNTETASDSTQSTESGEAESGEAEGEAPKNTQDSEHDSEEEQVESAEADTSEEQVPAQEEEGTAPDEELAIEQGTESETEQALPSPTPSPKDNNKDKDKNKDKNKDKAKDDDDDDDDDGNDDGNDSDQSQSENTNAPSNLDDVEDDDSDSGQNAENLENDQANQGSTEPLDNSASDNKQSDTDTEYSDDENDDDFDDEEYSNEIVQDSDSDYSSSEWAQGNGQFNCSEERLDELVDDIEGNVSNELFNVISEIRSYIEC